MPLEIRTFGPPGTGKTTWLSRQIERAVEKYGADHVFASSFTKAAAAELAGREVPIKPENLGTLHALCYRGLGSPDLAEARAKDFNERHPSLAISGTRDTNFEDSFNATDDAENNGRTPGEELYSRYNVLRNRLVPRENWPASVLGFASAWEKWKEDADLIDYTGLIERAHREMLYPPGGARVGFVDEAQDMTPLQFSLVRTWGKSLDYFIIAGDDDQALYLWTGASPDSMLHPPIPDEDKRILKQSYRVPRAVQAVAMRWIGKVAQREPKEYLPRDYEGEVRELRATWKNPDPVMADMDRYLGEGKSVMVLAACSFQLNRTISALRERGVPFHNPYRRIRGDWNPLAPRKGVSSVDRLLAFLRPNGPAIYWTPEQILTWAEACDTKGLIVRGGKAKLKALVESGAKDSETLLFAYDEIFNHEALGEIMSRLGPAAFLSMVKPPQAKRFEYLARVLTERGDAALVSAPQVTVGTIHSVKGGQADAVYLFPDLSPESYRAACKEREALDAVVRQYYVGMTRARESLILCQPATMFCVKGLK